MLVFQKIFINFATKKNMKKIIMTEDTDENIKTHTFLKQTSKGCIDACINFLYDKGYFDDFDIEEEDIRADLANKGECYFGGGYTNIIIQFEK